MKFLFKEALKLIGLDMTTEKFNFPVVDGTFKYQTKLAVELFVNPFQLTVQRRKGGIGKTVTIQKDVGDEYTIE